MTIFRPAANKALLVSPGGRRLLYKPLRAAPAMAAGAFSGPYPSAIAGLSGWWDAGAASYLLGAGGVALSDFGPGVTGAADKSGAGSPLSVYHFAASGTVAPAAVPRAAGLLGGLGASTVAPPNLPPAGELLPVMDPDNGLRLASAQMGAGAAWTRYLVWTRPNLRQGGSTAAVALLTAGSTVVLAADSTASPARLILFPGASQTVLTTALERRHTHSVILRNTPGAGVDVWLDGTQVASAAPNPMAASAVAPLLFLHAGTAAGGAQCWFHEAATWERALASADVATLLSCATRWPRGARRGVSLLVIGQSNAGDGINAGAWHMLAQGVAWHLGAAAWNVIGKYGSSGSATCVAGHGIYAEPADGFNGSFLTNNGGDPSTWPLGQDGNGVVSVLTADPADAPDVAAILFPWSESDSTRLYSEAATWNGAARRLMALLRAQLGRTAAQLPVLWWNPIPFPYGNTAGMQMIREQIAALAADSTQNVVVAMPQTADSNNLGATWNATTGVQTGGDNDHRDPPDLIAFGQRAAAVAARAIAAAGGGDSAPAIPAGLPVVGGPRIAGARLASPTSVVVTVTHDTGTDLAVPLLAAQGQGWALMDGGSVASPGPIRTATACARSSPTTLTLTLGSAATSPAASCLLFYPYGYFDIGRGDAVTDNSASVAPPAGWDIGHDLGSSWTFNRPLAATSVPVALTAAVVYPDGSGAAPSGAAQHPTLLGSYAARPPWKVAGVDYAVGCPSGTTLTDWQALSGAGITVNSNSVSVYNTANVVISGVDFSLHGGAYLYFVNSPNPTVRNCKFGGTAITTSVTSGLIAGDTASPGLTFLNNVVDGGGAGSGSCLIFWQAAGTITLEYNWFLHFPSRVIELGSGGALTYQFNLVENGGYSSGAHLNSLEWESGTATSPVVSFNTIMQTATVPANGEVFQWYFNGSGTLSSPTCSNNTIVATTTTSGNIEISYAMHGSSANASTTLTGTALIQNNYFDSSAAYGPFYAGTFAGWTASGNIDMTTGAAVAPG